MSDVSRTDPSPRWRPPSERNSRAQPVDNGGDPITKIDAPRSTTGARADADRRSGRPRRRAGRGLRAAQARYPSRCRVRRRARGRLRRVRGARGRRVRHDQGAHRGDGRRRGRRAGPVPAGHDPRARPSAAAPSPSGASTRRRTATASPFVAQAASVPGSDEREGGRKAGFTHHRGLPAGCCSRSPACCSSPRPTTC